ncbi:MAG TPA: hypothetical protein VGL91_16370 [Acidobacteriota bacterium]
MRRTLHLVLALFMGLAAGLALTYSGQCEIECALNGQRWGNWIGAAADPIILARSMDPSPDQKTCHHRSPDKNSSERKVPRHCMLDFHPQNQTQMQVETKTCNALVVAATEPGTKLLFAAIRLSFDGSPPHSAGPASESRPLRV